MPLFARGDRGVEKINIIFMITTRIEPPLLTGSFDTVVTEDTKANMLMAANIWGYDYRVQLIFCKTIIK